MTNLNFGVIVPTCNAGSRFPEWIAALNSQSQLSSNVLIIDSSSADSTRQLAQDAGFTVETVSRRSFNHGRTRQLGVEKLASLDVVVFLTQDAFLANNDSLRQLLSAFEDDSVGVAYGRQLPREDAGPIEAHARFFNYPPTSQIKSIADSQQLGIKTCFISNSFAAYRTSALQQVGGFPENNIVSEDTYVAAKMLQAGWKIRYCAEATVYHSHNYTMMQEFQRYFDLGVFHAREPWIRSRFGEAEGEGKRFVTSQLSFLQQENIFLIPSALLRILFKYLGFRCGFCEAYLPYKVKMWLSMQRNFWMK